jgi:hypothetical protein
MWTLNRTTASVVELPVAAAGGAELPARVVSVAEPVGAVVTDTGVTFGIAPLRPFTRPIRLTCTHCSWQVAVVGLPAIGERARDHALLHDPVVESRPGRRFAGPIAARLRLPQLLRLSPLSWLSRLSSSSRLSWPS